MLELTSVNPDGPASFNSMYRWRQNLVFLIQPYIGTRMSARPINALRISCSERNVEQYTKTRVYTCLSKRWWASSVCSSLKCNSREHEKLNFVIESKRWNDASEEKTSKINEILYCSFC